MKVVVDRAKWYRGRRGTYSKLRRADTEAKMCCLGFACLALGFTPEEITNKPMPGNLEDPRSLMPNSWLDDDTGSMVITNLAALNDSVDLSDDAREAKLTEQGKKIGIEFEFV